jgi:hypothetical protein
VRKGNFDLFVAPQDGHWTGEAMPPVKRVLIGCDLGASPSSVVYSFRPLLVSPGFLDSGNWKLQARPSTENLQETGKPALEKFGD